MRLGRNAGVSLRRKRAFTTLQIIRSSERARELSGRIRQRGERIVTLVRLPDEIAGGENARGIQFQTLPPRSCIAEESSLRDSPLNVDDCV